MDKFLYWQEHPTKQKVKYPTLLNQAVLLSLIPYKYLILYQGKKILAFLKPVYRLNHRPQ